MDGLKDYSGDFIPKIKYEDFSREFLARMLVEFGRCYIMADAQWYAAVKERYGEDVAYEMDYNMWVNILPPYEAARTLRALNLQGNDVADAIKFWQLAPSFPQDMFEYDIELKNRNHALITIHRCPGLLRFESKEPERIPSICQVLEPASANAYAKAINPDIVVTMPTMPPRKSPDDICCQFEFKLEK
ncbi:DUF6125 family protein [Chloroflexota bacterium]